MYKYLPNPLTYRTELVAYPFFPAGGEILTWRCNLWSIMYRTKEVINLQESLPGGKGSGKVEEHLLERISPPTWMSAQRLCGQIYKSLQYLNIRYWLSTSLYIESWAFLAGWIHLLWNKSIGKYDFGSIGFVHFVLNHALQNNILDLSFACHCFME